MIVNPLKVQWSFGNFTTFTFVYKSFLTVLVHLILGLVMLNNFLLLSCITTTAYRTNPVYIFWLKHFCNDKLK